MTRPARSQDVAVDIDVLANDTNLTDPVTVTKTAATNGVVTVNGSPGQPGSHRHHLHPE